MPGFKSSCPCAKYHPGLCSPFIHIVVSNNSVSGQWRPWSDCADAQADLGLRTPYMLEDTFSYNATYVSFARIGNNFFIFAGVRCYLCDSVSHAEDCAHVGFCGASQVCYSLIFFIFRFTCFVGRIRIVFFLLLFSFVVLLVFVGLLTAEPVFCLSVWFVGLFQIVYLFSLSLWGFSRLL